MQLESSMCKLQDYKLQAANCESIIVQVSSCTVEGFSDKKTKACISNLAGAGVAIDGAREPVALLRLPSLQTQASAAALAAGALVRWFRCPVPVAARAPQHAGEGQRAGRRREERGGYGKPREAEGAGLRLKLQQQLQERFDGCHIFLQVR